MNESGTSSDTPSDSEPDLQFAKAPFEKEEEERLRLWLEWVVRGHMRVRGTASVALGSSQFWDAPIRAEVFITTSRQSS